MAEATVPTCIVCWGKPPTVNKPLSLNGRRFLADLRAAYHQAGGKRQYGLLCARVCWFVFRYDPHRDPDADNISKKLWDTDGLGSIAFADDKAIRLRTAAIISLSPPGANSPTTQDFDLSGLPPMVIDALPWLLIGERPDGSGPADGFAYIECGPLLPHMLIFAEHPLPPLEEAPQ